MLFNSIEFVIFLPIVFMLYWFVANRSVQGRNLLVIAASYVFYGWWDWRFLSLIILSSVVDFAVGRQLGSTENERQRRSLLTISVLLNLGLLGFFKYYNFFVESFIDAFATLGVTLQASSLNIILPVGISFYTFQTLSYTIDVYRKKLEPTQDPLAFFAFVSFFPQLVAGPIERATNLLPQFYSLKKFDIEEAKDGTRQALWGLFKKVVIADNCALAANDIFANYDSLPASTLVLGAVFFAFQIYGDFSGYSDIAIGVARIFGFKLMRNFAYPYFSRDIGEFWRRWHISLSTWFRDYLYIPLGGNRGSKWKQFRNVIAIFVVSGFWHGANWTFIVWGALNALYFLPLMFSGKNRQNMGVTAEGRWLPRPKEFLQISLTFALTCLAWVFFRAESVTHAFAYLTNMADASLLTVPSYLRVLPFVLILILIEWPQRNKLHPLEIQHFPRPLRWGIYYVLLFAILYYQPNQAIDFIYFQF